MRVLVEVETLDQPIRKIWLQEHQHIQIGSTEWADVAIVGDRELADVHFVLSCDRQSCRVKDLGTQAGTYVNDTRVDEQKLSDGDRIHAGRTTFRIAITDVNPQVPEHLQMPADGHAQPTAPGQPAPYPAPPQAGPTQQQVPPNYPGAVPPSIGQSPGQQAPGQPAFGHQTGGPYANPPQSPPAPGITPQAAPPPAAPYAPPPAVQHPQDPPAHGSGIWNPAAQSKPDDTQELSVDELRKSHGGQPLNPATTVAPPTVSDSTAVPGQPLPGQPLPNQPTSPPPNQPGPVRSIRDTDFGPPPAADPRASTRNDLAGDSRSINDSHYVPPGPVPQVPAGNPPAPDDVRGTWVPPDGGGPPPAQPPGDPRQTLPPAAADSWANQQPPTASDSWLQPLPISQSPIQDSGSAAGFDPRASLPPAPVISYVTELCTSGLVRFVAAGPESSSLIEVAACLARHSEFYLVINFKTAGIPIPAGLSYQHDLFAGMSDVVRSVHQLLLLSDRDPVDRMALLRQAQGKDAVIGVFSNADRGALTRSLRDAAPSYAAASLLGRQLAETPAAFAIQLLSGIAAVAIDAPRAGGWEVYANPQIAASWQDVGFPNPPMTPRI